jgi:hypothetical protein
MDNTTLAVGIRSQWKSELRAEMSREPGGEVHNDGG